jgi:hypothetical protein
MQWYVVILIIALAVFVIYDLLGWIGLTAGIFALMYKKFNKIKEVK